MSEANKEKLLFFLGNSRKELKKFPKKVTEDIGFDLHLVQIGQTPADSKPIKGLSGVMELVKPHSSEAYRKGEI